MWERRRRRRDRQFEVVREEAHVWRVRGTAVERMVIQCDWDNEEAVTYLQHRFDRIGLDAALEKAGCVPGDVVRILDYEFDFQGAYAPNQFDELADRDDVVLGEFAWDGGED